MVLRDDSKARVELLHKQEEEELARILSEKYGVTYADLSLLSINTDALRLLPEAEAREAEAAVFARIGKNISVALRAPESDKAKAVVAKLEDLGYTITRYMVSLESLKLAWARYADLSFATETKAGIFELSAEELEKHMERIKNLRDIDALIAEVVHLKRTYRITRILEITLAGALAQEASDIHFEPEEERVARVRYRLDGVLVDAAVLDKETYRLMLSRIKLLSGLKLNVADEAQDGRFSIKVKGADIEIRTSVLPGPYAESVVLRLLNPDTIAVPLEELGMSATILSLVKTAIGKPNGMVLTTGPTGSGKTTTLYAFLRTINKKETKIITIEDPIEYHLDGIVQTQVDKKHYSFALGLRSALRQDPDVIMVGEIRDKEVAEVAVQAALTGHLVFSTLHTNNAAGSFPRLIDLGVSEKLLASSITVSLAQRLVRTLCSSCKRARAATKEEFAIIERHMRSLANPALLPRERGRVFTAVGCPACRGSGYKGRIGIFEAITMTPEIERVLETSASERVIAEAARSQGYPTMAQDGILKVVQGITTLEELARVVDLGEA